MPSKTSQHIAFFVVLFVSLGLHIYVFNNLKRILRRDYPKLGSTLIRVFAGLFILMDLPFAFLWFQGGIHSTLTVASHIIIYPFLVWQTVMLMWAIILFPISLIKRTGILVRYLWRKSNKAAVVEPELVVEVATE